MAYEISWKWIFLTFFVYSSFALVGQDKELPPFPDGLEQGACVRIAEVMPILRECASDSLSHTEQRKCTVNRVNEMIYKNLRWPAPDFCGQGTVVISFVVEKNGELTNFKVVRSLAKLADAEAVRVVKLMAKSTAPWMPGATGADKQAARFLLAFPVKFELQ